MEPPCCATEMGRFVYPKTRRSKRRKCSIPPRRLGLKRSRNQRFHLPELGPSIRTHGVLRIVLQLDGEQILDLFGDRVHHRGAMENGRGQTWHTFIPYTDRNRLPGGVVTICLPDWVEKLAGSSAAAREGDRVMSVGIVPDYQSSGLVRHVRAGSGALSPCFTRFNDRERAFGIIEALRARMHPNWFRSAAWPRLPKGWDTMFRIFIKYLPPAPRIR